MHMGGVNWQGSEFAGKASTEHGAIGSGRPYCESMDWAYGAEVIRETPWRNGSPGKIATRRCRGWIDNTGDSDIPSCWLCVWGCAQLAN